MWRIRSIINHDRLILKYGNKVGYFSTAGEQVYAHKCVLANRCQVMAAMFGGHFKESSSDDITQVHNVQIRAHTNKYYFVA